MRMMVLDEVESGSQLARSPKGGRPTREAASQLGAHILDVAIEHFLRHGFEGANMDAIAADAQVSKRTLYQRHESKKGLLLAVLERERHIYLAIVDTPLPEGSARQRIALLAQTILDDILTPKIRGFVKLREEVERVEPGFDDDSRDIVMGHWISAFRSILAGDPGLSGLDPDRLQFMASFLFDTLVTLPFFRVEARRDLPDTRQARAIEIERALDIIAEGMPTLRRP